jgi:hypothetical protein
MKRIFLDTLKYGWAVSTSSLKCPPYCSSKKSELAAIKLVQLLEIEAEKMFVKAYGIYLTPLL